MEARTIPVFFPVRDFGALNSLLSLILPHLAFSSPSAVWVLRDLVNAVPAALEEQALIDGASRAQLVFFDTETPDRGGVMAASTVMTAPVLVFFVLVHRRLVSGLGGADKDRTPCLRARSTVRAG